MVKSFGRKNSKCQAVFDDVPQGEEGEANEETKGATWVILVNMVISVILGHEKTKIQNILDLGKIDVFSVRTNIYIKNKKMGHLI